MLKVALHNLGCKVNSYETEAMKQLLENNGYEIVPFTDKADVYIVNTCSVTNMADRKSRQMLHKAKKKNPEGVVVATGCYVQTATEKIKEDLAIDIVVGNNKKKDIVNILKEYFEDKEKSFVIDINNTDEYEDFEVATVTEHTRAHIKIQDGCNNFCSYCIIPYARGRIRSRKLENIKEEIVRLSEKGFHEVVLTGINLGFYKDEDKTLIDVIEMADSIEGIERIRLGSVDPEIITEEFVARLKHVKKMCPHFHLSMQSGCDNVLKAMNRHYTTKEYFEKCEMLRSIYENPAITTDIIVGFPGETEEDFQETLDVVRKVRYDSAFTFQYSKRTGTPAAVLEDQISPEVMKDRFDRLLKEVQTISAEVCSVHKGTIQRVLVETKNDHDEHLVTGRMSNNLLVHFPGDASLIGKLVDVELKECHGFYYMGEIVS